MICIGTDKKRHPKNNRYVQKIENQVQKIKNKLEKVNNHIDYTKKKIYQAHMILSRKGSWRSKLTFPQRKLSADQVQPC